jgi:hypothetical protein
MSRVMTSRIRIGRYVFNNRINSVSVKSSWKELSDTAVIKLANLKSLANERSDDLIKVGDSVLIELGYDNNFKTEFTGYVSRIKPSIPLEIECEDQMWKLKQSTISQSWKSTTLREVLNTIVPDSIIDCPDITLSPFRLDNVSPAKALQRLKEEYMLCAYVRDGKLHVGLPYFETLGTIIYHFQKNIPKQQGSLEYRTASDLKIKVKAISVMPNNTREEIEVGDDDGDTTTMHYYNKTKAELKPLAEQKIQELKVDGYKGSIAAFGQPFATHGMVVDLRDDRYPARAGKFFVDSVSTEFSSSGFRRTIELGRRAQ